MKFLPHCEASCKTETKQPFEEQKENPSRLQRYVDEALAFHPLAILYPIIRVSQEEKKCEKIKTESDFACCQRACPHATYMVRCTAQHLVEIPGLGVWELVHLCDSTAPCWDSKSGSRKATASLAPSQPVWRILHGYGRKPNGRWDLTSAEIKLATI